MPMMSYFVGLIESQDIPFEFDLETKMFEVDLLYYLFSVKNRLGEYYPFWFPQSPVYSGVSDFLKRIKFDEKLGEKVSNELFGVNYEELKNILKQAREIFTERLQQQYGVWGLGNNPFRDF